MGKRKHRKRDFRTTPRRGPFLPQEGVLSPGGKERAAEERRRLAAGEPWAEIRADIKARQAWYTAEWERTRALMVVAALRQSWVGPWWAWPETKWRTPTGQLPVGVGGSAWLEFLSPKAKKRRKPQRGTDELALSA